MTKEERLIRSYFEPIEDINQDKSIEVLPLTLVDMLLEYSEILNGATVKRENECPQCQSHNTFMEWEPTFKCKDCNIRYGILD